MRITARAAVVALTTLGLMVSSLTGSATASEPSRQLRIQIEAALNSSIVDQMGLPMTRSGIALSVIVICPKGTSLDKRQSKAWAGEFAMSHELKTEYWPRGVVSRGRVAEQSKSTGVVAICTVRLGPTQKSFAASGTRIIGRVWGPSMAPTPLEVEMSVNALSCVALSCNGTTRAAAVPSWRSTRNFEVQGAVGRDAVTTMHVWGTTKNAVPAGESAEMKQALNIRVTL